MCDICDVDNACYFGNNFDVSFEINMGQDVNYFEFLK